MHRRLLPFVVLLLLLGCGSGPAPAAPPPSPAEAPAEQQLPSAAPAPAEAPLQDETEEAGPPDGWWLLDPEVDGVSGTGTTRAYAELLAGRSPRRTVVVAVLDSGIDIEHEDLTGRIWANAQESPNGRDDDGDGLVDDLVGWNYIGGPDGSHVDVDTYEVTRLYAACRAVTDGASPSPAPRPEPVSVESCAQIDEAFHDKRAENEDYLGQLRNIESSLEFALEFLRGQLSQRVADPDEYLNPDGVRALGATWTGQAGEVRTFYLAVSDAGITPELLEEEIERVETLLTEGLEPGFDPRAVVGDDYADPFERHYGNSDVAGPDATHGTGVAGVIAAVRGNDIGIDGIADSVRIMTLRVVPNGDERDKDIANGIRYAVDHGAHIINMSFGKPFSPWKEVVDEAVRYADERGVLLVHAAGNDGLDLAGSASYPSRRYLDGGHAEHWLEVGASGWEGGAQLTAPFSNYGAAEVDLFAPGVDIRTAAPGNLYDEASGTSFAAPVVSGIAALLMSHFPELTAAEVRQILLSSVTPMGDVEVILPGTDDERVRFGTLSVTGGIVNAYHAVRMAIERSGEGAEAGPDLTGLWIFTVVTENGTGTPSVSLQQEGERITGSYSSPRLGARSLEGTMKADTLTFRLGGGDQPADVVMTFVGTLQGDGSISGVVDFGGMGSATFTAHRASAP